MRTWEGCEHGEKCRGLHTKDSFLNEMDGAINMQKKLTSVDLNNSSVEVRVVDSNHNFCIEFFTILLIPLSTA